MAHYLTMYTLASHPTNDKHVTLIVNIIYFSYHDAVKVQIRFQLNNLKGIDVNISN